MMGANDDLDGKTTHFYCFFIQIIKEQKCPKSAINDWSVFCYQVFFYNFWPHPQKVGDVIYERPLSFFLSIVVYVMLSVCLSMTLYFSGVPSTDLFTQALLCAIRANFDLRNEKNTHKSQFICNWKKKSDLFFFLCLSIKDVLFSLKGILTSDA